MKLAILGATGWIGSTITAEALSRGHEIIGLARDINKLPEEITAKRSYDIQGDNALKDAIAGADALIVTIGGRALGNHEIVAATAQKILTELADTDINQLIWVGGAGSLEVAPGVALLSAPGFPEEYKAEAIAQGEALAVFKNSNTSVNWHYVSPAAEIFPGEKSGHYRVGGDQLLTDAEGNSKISVQDYASGLLDEVESNAHPQQRIGLAY